MRRADLAELMALAAIWGASFLFLRLGAAEFGPVALAFVRVALAAAVLLPWMLWRGDGPALRRHWRPILGVGLVNSALPFVAFGVAALAIPAGLMSIMNATVPLWTAAIAWLWLAERPGRWRALGMAIGLGGVTALSLQKSSLPAMGGVGPLAGFAACAAATAMYGFAANFTRTRLAGVPPAALAAGSQLSATLALALPAALLWPEVPPSSAAWGAASALALVCTALAYVMYFRLIAHVGATRAVTVTFLIPAFALAWGALFLAEPVTGPMLLWGGVILAGTLLATGLWPRQAAATGAASGR